MSKPVNRLATPLPDSVLDRYYAEHPEEDDIRKAASKSEPVQPTLDDLAEFFKD